MKNWSCPSSVNLKLLNHMYCQALIDEALLKNLSPQCCAAPTA